MFRARSTKAAADSKRRAARTLLCAFYCLSLIAYPLPALFAACGTAPTKLYFSTASGSLTGTQTLVTASGTEATDAGPKTAKTTSAWFQMKAGVTANTTSTSDSSTADSKGWINDAASIGAGCSLPSGTWTFSDTMSDSSGSQSSAVVSIHIYKANAGVFTAQACGFTNSNVSMSTTAATITATATCPQINFVAGDELYVEIYYESGSTNSSTSNSAQTTQRSLGANDFISFPQDITTPGPQGQFILIGSLGRAFGL